MTLCHHLIPDLLSRCAAEVLYHGASNVEHDVDPKSDVARPPKSVVNAERDKKTCPFEENTGF